MKKAARTAVLARPASPVAKYAKYTGRSGSMHGERKERSPSRNVLIVYSFLLPSL
jgi:hypothetical protein